MASDLPAVVSELTTEQKGFLASLSSRIPETSDGDSLHTLIYDLVKEYGDGPPAPFFTAIYLALIGKEKGPRAGHFLAALPAAFVRERLLQASQV